MDPASIPSVPAVVELAIYCYFVVVAAIGCYIHGRLWLGARVDGEYGDGGSSSDSGSGSRTNP